MTGGQDAITSAALNLIIGICSFYQRNISDTVWGKQFGIGFFDFFFFFLILEYSFFRKYIKYYINWFLKMEIEYGYGKYQVLRVWKD